MADPQLAQALERVHFGVAQLLLAIVDAQKLLRSRRNTEDPERLDELRKLLGNLSKMIPRVMRDSPIVLDVFIDSLRTASKWRWNIHSGTSKDPELNESTDLVAQYQAQIDAAIYALRQARRDSRNPKRHLFSALQSMGTAIAQLEPDGKGPASDAIFHASLKINDLRPVSDFAK